MMKKITLITGILCAFMVNAQNGLERIIVEKYYVADAADSTDAADQGAVTPLTTRSVTYRVYADLLPGYKVGGMYGTGSHTLKVYTSTAFYNDPNYGVSVFNGTSVNNTKKRTTLIDSYFTLGGVADGMVGILKSQDTNGSIGNIHNLLQNNNPYCGIPINGTGSQDGLLPDTTAVTNTIGIGAELDIFDQTSGGEFINNAGSIFVLEGVAGATDSNLVLLGQFTTDGNFGFELNLQIKTPTPGVSQNFVANSPTGEEIMDSTLTYYIENTISGGSNTNPTITLASASVTDSQSVCINNAILNIVYLVSNGDSVTVSGLPNGVTGISVADTFIISGTPSDTGTFNYTVTVVGANGNTNANGLITVSGCSGVDELNTDQISLFPNPTSEKININLGVNHGIISLMSADGKVIETRNSKNAIEVFDVSTILPGMYCITILTQEKSSTFRVIIN